MNDPGPGCGALAGYPTVVLGATTADRLGISRTDGGVAVWLGEQWFTVVGILAPAPLAPELDTAAMVGWPVAQQLLGFDGAPARIYERSPEPQVEAVRAVLPPTVNPANPEEVSVSRPSDALAAQVATDQTLLTLLLALGSVALLVGGIGGATLGGAVTAVFATSRDWPFALPPWVLGGAATATVLVGALAGAYPAARGARMSPTAALTTV